MKKIFAVFLCMLMCLALFSCGGRKVDYADAESLESALDAGEDPAGKTVTFTVKEIVPDSICGYNLKAGEKLNFCSSKNPKVKVGDTVTVQVESVSSMLQVYIISYKMK